MEFGDCWRVLKSHLLSLGVGWLGLGVDVWDGMDGKWDGRCRIWAGLGLYHCYPKYGSNRSNGMYEKFTCKRLAFGLDVGVIDNSSIPNPTRITVSNHPPNPPVTREARLLGTQSQGTIASPKRRPSPVPRQKLFEIPLPPGWFLGGRAGKQNSQPCLFLGSAVRVELSERPTNGEIHGNPSGANAMPDRTKKNRPSAFDVGHMHHV